MSIDVNVQNDLVIVTESSEDIVVNVSNAAGPAGPAGVGVPVGGATGQVLKKFTNTDFDTYWAADASGLTSVGLSMPTAFTVSNTPLTTNGTIAVTGAGTAAQYVRGDGQLATFPGTASGGSSVNYYLNGSINASVAGYKQLANNAIIGTGTNFALTGNGLIAQFLTDVGNPNRVEIPGGAWNFEMFFEVSSSGGNQKFYVELLKYNGTTFTSIASGITVPEEITGGTSIDLYLTSLAVPTTALLVTDRLAIRVYIVDNAVGRTITLHTEDNTLCEIITTFSGGIAALNGLSANTQYLATGTSGTDFNISSLTDTHTFNLPTASATNRGALSTTDWSTFNNKVPTTRTLTINGTAYDLSADRSWTVSGTNIYSADGTLTSSRTLTSGGFPLTFTGSNTAALSIARGLNLTHTLIAAANNDVLVGLDINPTFTNGVFTGVNNAHLRIGTNTIVSTTRPACIDMGGSFSSVAGQNLKIKLLYNGIDSLHGFGYSGSGIDYVSTNSPQCHHFYQSTNKVATFGYSGGVGVLDMQTTFSVTEGQNLKIQVYSSSYGFGISGGQLDYVSANRHAFFTGSSKNLTLFNTGNLLIQAGGTHTDAGYKLDVNGTARVSGQLRLGTTSNFANITGVNVLSNNIYFDGSNVSKYITSNVASAYLQVSDGRHLWQQAPSGTADTTASFSTKMEIFANGRLATGGASDYGALVNMIGTTSDALQIGNANYLKIGGQASGTQYIKAFETDFTIGNAFSGGSLILMSGNATSAKLTAAGRLLLGTVSESTYLLDVNGTARVTSDTLVEGVLRETVTTNRQTASYTLALTDRGKLVEMNVAGANNLTVPLNSVIAFPIGTKIDLSQYGAGQTTVVATGGVTVRSAGGALKLAAQYSGASLVKIGTDEWYLFGDITV